MSTRTVSMIVLIGLAVGGLQSGCTSLPPEALTWSERDLIRGGGVGEPMKLVLNSNREGNEQLRRPSLEVEPNDPDVKLLVRRMTATVKKADGVGLAASQVGVNRRVIVVQRLDQGPDHPYVAYLNPEITRYSRTHVTDWEGCLSVPGGYGRVERASAIHISFDQADGTRAANRVKGFTARIFQHEIDHLDGVLFIDRMGEVTLISREEMTELRRRMREKAKKEAAEDPEEPEESPEQPKKPE